jgi:hypothetical protein
VIWYLITKTDEYRLGRFTSTRCANELKHGWRIVTCWALRPTHQAVTESIFIDQLQEEI